MYTVVFERENAPPSIRWKWYVAKHEGRRQVTMKEGAASSREVAAEEADQAYKEMYERQNRNRSTKGP